jgi:CheY-like chemotaxis protein
LGKTKDGWTIAIGTIFRVAYNWSRVNSQKTVLVVEDEEPTRNLIVAALKAAGYNVLEASNPTEAAKIFGADLFLIDVLFADIYMPTMSGPDFARELMAVRPDLGVVFATGRDQNVVKETMDLVRHKRFLQKPYTVEELREAVSAAYDDALKSR